jgi:hypothetical protein
MIYVWFRVVNYHKLSIEKDRDSIFTTITIICKPGFTEDVRKASFASVKGSLQKQFFSSHITSNSRASVGNANLIRKMQIERDKTTWK